MRLEKMYRIINKCIKDKAPSLNLSNLRIKDINKVYKIDQCTHIQSLSLSGNIISEIKSLDKFTNLEMLKLDNNKITKIENLDKLVGLKELHLESNKITKIENLENLMKLEFLNLNSNKISKVEFSDLTKFTTANTIHINNKKHEFGSKKVEDDSEE